jgi:hypothetical protein
MRHLKKINSFSTISEQVWTEEEISVINSMSLHKLALPTFGPLIMSLDGKNPTFPRLCG